MPKLLTSPAKYTPAFHMLTHSANNKQEYERLYYNTDGIDFKLPDGFLLVRNDLTETEFELAVLDLNNQAVVYYNKVRQVDEVFLGAKPVVQCLVWRSTKRRYVGALRGVAGDVFFEYLLKTYNVVMSDNEQTLHGHQFWMYQIDRAMEEGMYVYKFDQISCELTRVYDETETVDFYGSEDEYWTKLLIISVDELPHTVSK